MKSQLKDLRRFNIAIPVPIPDFQALSDYMERTSRREEIGELAGQAIRRWLAQQAAEEKIGKGKRPLTGYQWKNLFLPSGTILRFTHKCRNYHATVKGDSIVHEGKVVSPSQFVNTIGTAAGRNAWKRVWLLFPGEANWKLAAKCRGSDDVTPRARN